MITIEGTTLEEAFEKAATELNCSVTNLEFEVVQHPKKGFLGFGKKKAIVVANCKQKAQEAIATAQPSPPPIENRKPAHEEESVTLQEPVSTPQEEEITVISDDMDEDTTELEAAEKSDNVQKEQIIDNFFQEKQNIDDVIYEVKLHLERLFEHACFEIDTIDVSVYDEHTLYIEFSGNDAALLIGKEGYRYKALSYMLFNWINTKYGLMLRLEIAEFLKNQEEMISHYLEPVISNIEREGRGQTKPLDGVLAHIALKQLRERFPDKYVSFRQNNDGDRYVIVNEFKGESR